MAGLTSLCVPSDHLVALATTLLACSLQRSSWSSRTPRNLWEVSGMTVVSPNVRLGLGAGIVLPGRWASGAHRRENPTSMSLDSSKCELWSWDQSKPPPSRDIISLSL